MGFVDDKENKEKDEIFPTIDLKEEEMNDGTLRKKIRFVMMIRVKNDDFFDVSSRITKISKKKDIPRDVRQCGLRYHSRREWFRGYSGKKTKEIYGSIRSDLISYGRTRSRTSSFRVTQ